MSTHKKDTHTSHHTHEKKHESHATHHEHETHHKKQKEETVTKKELYGAMFITAIVVIAIMLLGFVLFNGSSNSTTTPTTTVSGDTVTIIEYSDFECPFCSRALDALEQVKAEYGDKVTIEYKHFPLSFHPSAQKAAEASECARDQEKFWEMHDILFANQDALSVANYKKWAGELGLDQATFDQCLDSGEKEAIVAADQAEGAKLGVSGTPSFFINGEMLVGAQPFSAFKVIIDKALTGVASDTTTAQEDSVDTSSDPAFTMYVVNDKTCGACNTANIIDVTQTQLFPSVVVEELDITDAQGKQLVEDLGVTALPAYIMESGVTQTANFDQVSGALIQAGDYYIISPSATGEAVKLLVDINTDGAYMKGDVNAPVTIVEFSDFECPYCEKFYTETYGQIVEQYIDTGKANIVFLHFPLSFHDEAEPAAIAAECAGEQGMFWEFHDTLFENQASLSAANYKQWASDLGLDTTQFNSCVDSNKYQAKVQADLAYGQTLGVSGTPGFFVNGVQLTGAQPFSAFQDVIDAALEE